MASGGIATIVVSTALHLGGSPVGWGVFAGLSSLATTLAAWRAVHLVQQSAYDRGYAAGMASRSAADDFFGATEIARPTYLPAEHHVAHVDIEAPAPAADDASPHRGGDVAAPAPIDAELDESGVMQREAEMDVAFGICAAPQRAYFQRLEDEADALLRERQGF